MTRYGIDARTLVHLVDEDITSDAGHQLVAPGWLRSEALQLLLEDVRAGRRTEAEALAAHTRATEVKVRLLSDRVSRRTAWDLTVEHGWPSLHRAEYLAVTKLQADALVALDPDVALAEGIVPLADVDDLTRPHVAPRP